MLNNWKLRDRTLLGFSIPTILIFVFSIIVYNTTNQVLKTFRQLGISQTSIINTDSMGLAIANMDRSVHLYLLDPIKHKDALDMYAKFKQEYNDSFQQASNVIEDALQKERLKSLQNIFHEYDTAVKEAISPTNIEEKKADFDNNLKKYRDYQERFAKINDDLTDRDQVMLEQSIKATKSMLNFMSLLALIVTVSTITIAIIITSVVAKSLGSRVFTAVNVADKIAAGDLTASWSETGLNSKDEIGQLLISFKLMIQKWNNLIKKVQTSGIQVTTSATQIAASGKQLEATISEQVASTNEVTAAAKEIAATSKELLKTMEQVMGMSQVTTTAATVSQKDLMGMETSMQQLAKATNSIAARLGIISEKANNINNIVLTITKVADQTNLLSLNAAIEAEKAGEYGLGFAVVAREIRRLADQTAVATLDIEQMVKQMQSSVSTGVMEMDKFAAEVSLSVNNVGNMIVQIGQIIQQVQNLNPRFESVNKGMEIQSVGAQQISDAMTQLSSTSIQTADSLREINYAIAQLTQVARSLHQEVSVFKVKVDEPSLIEHKNV